MEYFGQDMSYMNENKRRFLIEQFLDYEIFKKNLEKSQNEKGFINNLNGENSINLNGSNIECNISYETSLKILNLGANNQIDEKNAG